MSNQEIYQKITEKLLSEMKEGIIPWHKPWMFTGIDSETGCYSRFSYVKKRNEMNHYSLLNCIMLGKGGEYGTMKQWNSIGGTIRKGTHAQWVVFSKNYSFTNERPIEPLLPELGSISDKRNVWLFHWYPVFHIDDVEGVQKHPYTIELEAKREERKRKFDNAKDIDECSEVMKSYLEREGIKLFPDCPQAFYRPSDDTLHLPAIFDFDNVETFYSTAFHECGHSTGHEKRLGREICNRFGTKQYAAEELIAEMTAAFTCARLGIDLSKTIRNSAAYIQNWSRKLGSVPELLGKAVPYAKKATEMIFGEYRNECSE